MEIKKGEISMKNSEKGPNMCFSQVKKISCKLYRISGTQVVLCPMFKTHRILFKTHLILFKTHLILFKTHRILFKTKIYEKKYKKSESSYHTQTGYLYKRDQYKILLPRDQYFILAPATQGQYKNPHEFKRYTM